MKFRKVVVRVQTITPLDLYEDMGRARVKLMEYDCIICLESFKSPNVVQCVTCSKKDNNVFLCVTCFRLGAESGDHTRGHEYDYNDVGGIPVFDRKKSSVKKWGYKEDLFLLENILEYRMDEWKHLHKIRFDKTATTEEALMRFDRCFLRGKLGQHVLSEIRYPKFVVMTGKTYENGSVEVEPPTNFSTSKFSDLANFIRNCDADELPDLTEDDWFEKIEQLKNKAGNGKKRSAHEKDHSNHHSNLRARRLSSISNKDVAQGMSAYQKFMDFECKPSTSASRPSFDNNIYDELFEFAQNNGYANDEGMDDDTKEDEEEEVKMERSLLRIKIKRNFSMESPLSSPPARVLRSRPSGGMDRMPMRRSRRVQEKKDSELLKLIDETYIDIDECSPPAPSSPLEKTLSKKTKNARRSSLRNQLRRGTLDSDTSVQTSEKISDIENSDEEMEIKDEKDDFHKPVHTTPKTTPKNAKHKPKPLKLHISLKSKLLDFDKKPKPEQFLFSKDEMMELRNKYPDPYFYSHGNPLLDEEGMAKLKEDDLNLIGYMPKRDDFEEECNWDAEKLISRLIFIGDPNYPSTDDERLLNETKFILLARYNRTLKKRMAKHGVLREHELVNEFFNVVKKYTSERGKYTFMEDVPLLTQKKKEFYAPLFGRAHQVLDKNLIEELIKHVAKTDFLMDRIQTLQKLQREGVTKLPMRLKMDTPLIARSSTKKKRKKTRYTTYQPNRKANLRWQRIKRWQKRMNEADPEDFSEE